MEWVQDDAEIYIFAVLYMYVSLSLIKGLFGWPTEQYERQGVTCESVIQSWIRDKTYLFKELHVGLHYFYVLGFDIGVYPKWSKVVN